MQPEKIDFPPLILQRKERNQILWIRNLNGNLNPGQRLKRKGQKAAKTRPGSALTAATPQNRGLYFAENAAGACRIKGLGKNGKGYREKNHRKKF